MAAAAQTTWIFPRDIFGSSLRLFNDQRWLSQKSSEFSELLESCPTDQHRHMLIDLLARTTYITAEEHVGIIGKMRDHVEDVWKLAPSTTLFVSSNNKHHADSSREVLNQLKSSAWKDPDWNRQQFHVAFTTAIDAAKNGYTLVIADDFVGSGGSMLDALKWFAKKAEDKKITVDLRVLTAGGCEEGISNIQNAGYAVQCMVMIKKGLSDHLSGQQLSDAVSQMTELEDALDAKIGGTANFAKFRFGWRQQEAVYLRQGGNTPNNVFPIFWWRRPLKSGTRSPVMHRT